jgi:hypothetical protein
MYLILGPKMLLYKVKELITLVRRSCWLTSIRPSARWPSVVAGWTETTEAPSPPTDWGSVNRVWGVDNDDAVYISDDWIALFVF